MPVRVFSNEDGNLNSKSVIVSRTKQNADIDLSFSAKFIFFATNSNSIFKSLCYFIHNLQNNILNIGLAQTIILNFYKQRECNQQKPNYY